MPAHASNQLIQPRRAFLADMGMGFVGLVLGAMLHRDGAQSPPMCLTGLHSRAGHLIRREPGGSSG